MRNRSLKLLVLCLVAAAAVAVCRANPKDTNSPDPIINAAPEQQWIDPQLADGGLPPVLGVQNIGVFRASRVAGADGRGFTYNHHVDLAQWRGRMYVAWTSGQKDEDVWPSHELFATSQDGFTWTAPAELFPQGASQSLRMYFFHAPSDRMLAIAGLRTSTAKLTDASQGGLVVRAIRDDHTLGPPYILRAAPAPPMLPLPRFDKAPDAAFITACRQLLADHTFLEQQDFGVLLGKDRMAAYHDAPEDFGKAFCFFHRKDGALVGIAKKAWTVLSTDNGKTWSSPVQPKSIITDSAKEWVQRTTDGKYAFVFNPKPTDRFPLVLLTSNDGVTFSDMRTVHGQLPPQRYPGEHKNIGPQYVRGISEWATDGTTLRGAAAKDLWIAYSSNKEDIWVARIPVPIRIAETAPVHDRFDELPPAGFVPNWNTYSPAWAPLQIIQAIDNSKALALEDRDPYDHAQAERLFPESATPTVRLKLMAAQLAPDGTLNIELRAPFGDCRPVRLTMNAHGTLSVHNGAAIVAVAQIIPAHWTDLAISADTTTRKFSVSVDGRTTANLSFAEPAARFQRLTLYTGPYRQITKGSFPNPESDRPVSPSVFLIKDVDIR